MLHIAIYSYIYIAMPFLSKEKLYIFGCYVKSKFCISRVQIDPIRLSTSPNNAKKSLYKLVLTRAS